MTGKNEQLSTIWNKVLDEFSLLVPDRTLYTNFLKPSSLYSLEDTKAVIVTDSELAQKILSQDYSAKLLAAFKKVTETDYSLSIVSKNDLKKNKAAEGEIKSDKTPKINYFANSVLQPEYTFEDFVVGKSNKQAFQSAVYITEHPGSFNPLFIYSKSGLGKTHLLHAIGNAVKNKNPSMKVLYITSEDFVDEFVKFVQGDNDRESLKDFFKSIDFLLIDDIQFLAGKPATGTMFFNIFNLLVSQRKQIVITSDRSPSQLEGLEDRLVSRFSQGLSVSIEKPEKKTLIEILKIKIKSNGFDPSLFDEDALEFIADNNSSNIRVLEGALNRILFFNVAAGNTNRITLEIVRQAFADDVAQHKPGQLNSEMIIASVAKYYSLTESQILSKIRTLQISLARAIAMYLCRSLLDMSFAAIGQAFNGKDHTTVLAAYKKVDGLLKTDDSMKKAIKELSAELKA
jgi:chromosomal replication initiator protein